MKQKLAIMLLTACMALSCTFALAACNDTPTADSGDDPVITPGDDGTPTTPDDSEQHEHTYTSEVTTQPTCTQEGVITYTCTCGDSYTESIPTIAHNYVDGVCTMCGTPEPQPTEGLVFTLSDDGTDYAVTGYTGTEIEVYIPSVYKDLPVTSIGVRAFGDCHRLANVTIGNSVTSIEDSAFQFCSNLIGINIPDGVTSIGDSAFAFCSNLTSITIPDSVTSIGDSAFAFCSNLTSITIPDSVTSIGKWAFADCSSLTNVTIGNGVECIGVGAFSDCSNLENVTIGNGITIIESEAFYNCSSLSSVTFENTEGWTVDGEPIDANNPAQNAVYLTYTYPLFNWARGE